MPWQKGESGNKMGRPRSGGTIKELLLQHLSREDFAKEVIKRIKRGDTQMMKYVWDRIDGKMKDDIGAAINNFMEWVKKTEEE